MVERVLCKHEVVGSIPSGSTSSFDRIQVSSRFRPAAIDIVKEEFDRPLIGFQVRFEKTSSGK